MVQGSVSVAMGTDHRNSHDTDPVRKPSRPSLDSLPSTACSESEVKDSFLRSGDRIVLLF